MLKAFVPNEKIIEPSHGKEAIVVMKDDKDYSGRESDSRVG
jgi:hypothetical protein